MDTHTHTALFSTLSLSLSLPCTVMKPEWEQVHLRPLTVQKVNNLISNYESFNIDCVVIQECIVVLQPQRSGWRVIFYTECTSGAQGSVNVGEHWQTQAADHRSVHDYCPERQGASAEGSALFVSGTVC